MMKENVLEGDDWLWPTIAKSAVSAKDFASLWPPLLSGQPPLSGHLLVPQGWLLSGGLTVARITGNHYFLSPSFLNCRHGLGEGGRGCDLNVPIRPSHHMHDWMLTTGNCFFWNKFVTSNRHSSNESFDRFLTAMLGINQVIFDTIVTTNTPFLHLFWELKKVFSLLFFIHRIQINQVISQECSNMKWISIGLYCLFCVLGNCI